VKIRDLIEKLQKLDPNMQVLVDGYDDIDELFLEEVELSQLHYKDYNKWIFSENLIHYNEPNGITHHHVLLVR
jgi:hypothetical protein